ncbi:MAG: hypothetical protein KAQ69_09955 [Spirochaetales bacterium]|nr:hypothetical protein [Spirochaetales bacterium]
MSRHLRFRQVVISVISVLISIHRRILKGKRMKQELLPAIFSIWFTRSLSSIGDMEIWNSLTVQLR